MYASAERDPRSSCGKGTPDNMEFAALMDNLEALRREHAELLANSREKQTAIIGNDIDSVNRLTQRESKLVKSVERLDEERKLKLAAWMRTKRVPLKPDQTTLTMAETVTFNAGEKQELRRMRESLASVMTQLRVQNENNQRLIKQALQYVNFSLDLMTGYPEDDSTYHPPEQTGGMYTRSLFDRKA